MTLSIERAAFIAVIRNEFYLDNETVSKLDTLVESRYRELENNVRSI